MSDGVVNRYVNGYGSFQWLRKLLCLNEVVEGLFRHNYYE